jgi:protein-tyrosine phosphatase
VVADLLTRVRRTPERMFHPLRRRQVIGALRRRPRPARLLAVCHGNICRSPVAAALLGRELAPLAVEVHSAGFIGNNRPAPAEAIAAAARRGIDISAHRSRLLTADLVRAADLIVVMAPDQQRVVCERFGRWPRDVIVLGDLDPAPVEERTILDPVNQAGEVFDESYERIERCVRELASVIGSARA